MLENHDFTNFSESGPLQLAEQNNCFLIDWLTFVAHGDSVDYLKFVLGLDSPDIPWETEEKFRNGYPLQCYWNGITISYGADDERFYKDPTKVRHDMGICVNLSGTGCRAFESYGHGDWFRLFVYLFRDTDYIANEHFKMKSYNITRLDLAYDDHVGLLDLYRIEQDVRLRHYVSPAKYSEIIWSDNQNEDIEGLTIQVGSDKSAVKIRIYDKAAERGFKDRHWIRCEMQLRDDRAIVAAAMLLRDKHIGSTASGILRNYLTFREPTTTDTNKSRWPIADYWDKVLLDMEKISLWVTPGEPYNFSKTEHWFCKQYGQAIVVLDELHDPGYLIDKCREMFPVDQLNPKYKKFLAKLQLRHKPFDILPPDPGFVPADIWGDQDIMEGFE